MTVPDLPETLLEQYPWVCVRCNYEQTAAPSLFMRVFNINTGAGTCLNCKHFMHLMIIGDHMVSNIYDQYVTEMEARKDEPSNER